MNKAHRVHSKHVHSKHTQMLENLKIGKGGRAWLIIIFSVVNYEICTSPETAKVFWLLYSDVIKSLEFFSVFSMGAVNVLRWLLVYYASDQLKLVAAHTAIGLAVAMECMLSFCGPEGFVGVILRYISLMQLMKSISYLLAKKEIENLGKERGCVDAPCKEPSLLRFIMYPTLCYQQEYPVSEKVCFFMVVLYSLMLVPFSLLSYFCLKIKCYDTAVLFWKQPSLKLYADLFMWCNLGWMSGFILIFIAFYGLQSEITRFGDKVFFGSWWNASVPEYWRKWNLQVHSWIKRHVHKDLLKIRNITSRNSQIIIFVVSGLLHEYILGSALSCRGIGFFTMASQLPLNFFIQQFERCTKIDQKLTTIVAFNVIGAPVLAILSSAHKSRLFMYSYF